MTNKKKGATRPDWSAWRRIFEKRAERALPALDLRTDYSKYPPSLARSLAVFQLGESGGGTIVEQLKDCRLPGVDDDYVRSVELFVEEEHRHANILAMSVRLLQGELIQKNWTARLFVAARRLIGVRLKVIVLLAAEVVGICYYSTLASRLGSGPVGEWLSELVDDERLHLQFHCEFLRSQFSSRWRRRLFVLTWRSVMLAAGLTVLFDHRKTLRDLDIDKHLLWQRWAAIAEMAERLVTQPEDQKDAGFAQYGMPDVRVAAIKHKSVSARKRCFGLD